MTTNVPQDVIDDTNEAYKRVTGATDLQLATHVYEIANVLCQLRAQRQQGAEPVAWKYCPECGCFEFVKTGFSRGRFCKNCGQEWFEDIDYSGVVAGNLNRLFSPTPPQANALVAAAYRKAAEICNVEKAGYIEPPGGWDRTDPTHAEYFGYQQACDDIAKSILYAIKGDSK